MRCRVDDEVRLMLFFVQRKPEGVLVVVVIYHYHVVVADTAATSCTNPEYHTFFQIDVCMRTDRQTTEYTNIYKICAHTEQTDR